MKHYTPYEILLHREFARALALIFGILIGMIVIPLILLVLLVPSFADLVCVFGFTP